MSFLFLFQPCCLSYLAGFSLNYDSLCLVTSSCLPPCVLSVHSLLCFLLDKLHPLQLVSLLRCVSVSLFAWHFCFVFAHNPFYYLGIFPFFFSLPSRNPDPRSLSRPPPLLSRPHYGTCFHFCREKMPAIFLPSSTRIASLPCQISVIFW